MKLNETNGIYMYLGATLCNRASMTVDDFLDIMNKFLSEKNKNKLSLDSMGMFEKVLIQNSRCHIDDKYPATAVVTPTSSELHTHSLTEKVSHSGNYSIKYITI